MTVRSKLEEKNIDKCDFLFYAQRCLKVPEGVDIKSEHFYYVILNGIHLPKMFVKLELLLKKFLPQEGKAILSEQYKPQHRALLIFKDIRESLQGKHVSGITFQLLKSDKDKLMIKIKRDIRDATMVCLNEIWETLQEKLAEFKDSYLQGIQFGCVCVTWQFSPIQGMKEHILERIPHCEEFFNEVNIIKIVFNDEILYAIIIVHYNIRPNRFQVDFAFTVRQLKENLHEKCVVPLDPDRQCVHFQGEMLQDDMQQLEECGIQAGSNVYVHDRGEHEHGPAVEVDSPSISIIQNGKCSSERNIDAVSEKGSEHHQQLKDGSSQQDSEFNKAEVKQNYADQVEYQEYPSECEDDISAISDLFRIPGSTVSPGAVPKIVLEYADISSDSGIPHKEKKIDQFCALVCPPRPIVMDPTLLKFCFAEEIQHFLETKGMRFKQCEQRTFLKELSSIDLVHTSKFLQLRGRDELEDMERLLVGIYTDLALPSHSLYLSKEDPDVIAGPIKPHIDRQENTPEDSSVAHFDGSLAPKSKNIVEEVVSMASLSRSVTKNHALLEYTKKMAQKYEKMMELSEHESKNTIPVTEQLMNLVAKFPRIALSDALFLLKDAISGKRITTIYRVTQVEEDYFYRELTSNGNVLKKFNMDTLITIDYSLYKGNILSVKSKNIIVGQLYSKKRKIREINIDQNSSELVKISNISARYYQKLKPLYIYSNDSESKRKLQFKELILYTFKKDLDKPNLLRYP